MFSGVSNKTVRIEVLATAAEAKAIKAAAKQERRSVSSYVLTAAMRDIAAKATAA